MGTLKLFLDDEYIRDVNTKFNYVSLVSNKDYTHDVSQYSNADVDSSNSDGLPSICIYDNVRNCTYKYADDGDNVYHPVRRIGTNWYKLVPFVTDNTVTDENDSSLENN